MIDAGDFVQMDSPTDSTTDSSTDKPPLFREWTEHSVDCGLEGKQVSINEIVRSAKHGCSRCAIHEEAVFKCIPEPSLEDLDKPTISYHNGHTAYPTLAIVVDGLGSRHIQFFTTDSNSADVFPSLQLRPIERQPTGDTSSPASLDNALLWLDACQSSHSSCGSGLPQPLPTRILDVSSSLVRLLETSDEVDRYACLSHCWGSKPVLQTTIENIDAYAESIPWDDIPATFQDAITFTRSLSLKYLWIDSLCIIQNDRSHPSDWQKESVKMASIYQNSFVTLAAASAADSTEGCFTKPSQQLHRWHQLQCVQVPGHPDCSIYARLDSWHVSAPHDQEMLPLFKRAWVYQERLLAPRLVYFTGFELQWECREAHVCECAITNDVFSHGEWDIGIKEIYAEYLYSNRSFVVTPSDFSGSGQDTLYDDHNRSAKAESYIAPQSTRMNPVYDTSSKSYIGLYDARTPDDPMAWRQIVCDYTELDLTFSSDIFPALSGLAKVWWDFGHIKSRYLAGLWEYHLIFDLLWYTEVPCERPDVWRAPTWSWASLKNRWFQHHSTHRFTNEKSFVVEGTEIQNIDVEVVGPDWAGQVRDAQLTLSCRAISATVQYQFKHNWEKHLPLKNRQPFKVVINGAIYRTQAIHFDSFVWLEQHRAHLKSGSTLHILPLATTRFSAVSFYEESEDAVPLDDSPVECLVVHCIRRSDTGSVYERVGHAFLAPNTVSATTISGIETELAPELQPRDEDWKQEMGVGFERWQYDAHCKITELMSKAPIQSFTVV